MPKTHRLSMSPTILDAIVAGELSWMATPGHHLIQRGDIVDLYYPSSESSRKPEDNSFKFRVGWMAQGGFFGIKRGYCAFSLDPMEPAKTLYWSEIHPEPTADRMDLTDEFTFYEISQAIHSNVAPHCQWAVRIPICTDDCGEADDEEIVWFDSREEAQACIDSMTKEPEVIEPAPPAPCGGLTGSEIPMPQTPPSPDKEVIF